MKRILGLVNTVFVVCISVGALAETWYVDGQVRSSGDGTSWETAFQKIQEGIDAASDGDTVLVAAGTYMENIQFSGKNIVLQSSDTSGVLAISDTIIDGGQAGPVVTFAGTENESCVLSGFTIRNGKGEFGGGICGGTGNDHTHAMIRNNVISGKRALSGGGVALCDGAIEGNTISGNSATGTAGVGGGLYGCNGTIENNTISGNSANNYGGGLYECCGIIQNSTINNNRVPAGLTAGGGLGFCKGVLQNNTISGNSAGYGGGMYRGAGTILNNAVIANTAANNGGGVYWSFGIIRNNAISGNQAGSLIGGLGSCRGTILDCIVWATPLGLTWSPILCSLIRTAPMMTQTLARTMIIAYLLIHHALTPGQMKAGCRTLLTWMVIPASGAPRWIWELMSTVLSPSRSRK